MKKNILLVDDEKVFHMINSRIIARSGIEGEIQTASNGHEALGLINRYWSGSEAVPDIIFIDLNMPIMDGFEFIRVFKKMDFPHKHKTTLVILTSSVSLKDKQLAKDLGVDHFISKPLSEDDLRRLVLEIDEG
jgi:CheY-like chemotaxis protein